MRQFPSHAVSDGDFGRKRPKRLHPTRKSHKKDGEQKMGSIINIV